MKLVGNLIVSMQLEALGEAMILAARAGLNPHDVLGALRRRMRASQSGTEMPDAVCVRHLEHCETGTQAWHLGMRESTR